MRVVVTGATGNVGTAVLRRLAAEPAVTELAGVARRVPREPTGAYAPVAWHPLDVGDPAAPAALAGVFTGAAAVVHLAWQIQPSHQPRRLRRTNVAGTAHVAEAAVRAGVPALVVASSVGAYAPGSADQRVDESWPATGVPGSGYSAHKVAQEAVLDRVAREHPELRLVRLRPALTFQREAASAIARLFVGPFAPLGLLRFGRLPAAPAHPRLRVQGVHADDVADAYARAVLGDIRGAVNVAAEPVLDAGTLRDRFGGLRVPVPLPVLRAAAAGTWYARLQPTEPGWVDLAAGAPLMSCRRAEVELGWRPRVDALAAVAELLDGMAHRAGGTSAALRPRPCATARLTAVLTGRLPGHGDPY